VKSSHGWLASLASGAVLWGFATAAAGLREPWDSEHYWSIWLPAAFALSAVLGATFPDRSWRWPMAVMLVQLPVMLLLTGGGLGLLPLGAILLLILSLPGMLFARAGAAVRRSLERKEPA
jgi:hypothetical protein